MSEETNPIPNELDETPHEIQPLALAPISAPSEAATPAALPPPKSASWRWVAPAWFLAGVLVGLALFAGYQLLTAKPPPPPAAQMLDEATVRKAAREGLIEAIQALQAQNGQSNSSSAPQTVERNAFAVRAANTLGDANAKVSIVEYADFQCPYCGRHVQQVEPQLVQEYVNTGKANLVYKHLAFLGPESVYAAVAAECAADQNKFWEFHNYLFSHQNGENQGAFNKDKLIGFGQELGLDMTRFEPCVTSDATVERVQADTLEAQKFGVSSTPTFFVNGNPMVGLTSPDEFKTLIEQALTE